MNKGKNDGRRSPKKIYAFIEEYIRTKGLPPTIREIGGVFGIQSTGHVAHHLSRLEERGLFSG
jgi:repressor LexA